MAIMKAEKRPVGTSRYMYECSMAIMKAEKRPLGSSRYLYECSMAIMKAEKVETMMRISETSSPHCWYDTLSRMMSGSGSKLYLN